MLMLKEVIERCGVPWPSTATGIASSNAHPSRLRAGTNSFEAGASTQFARALAELGIELILAHTPQAKGRVERAWDTFQDRLVSEMRLAGTATIEEANRDAGLPAALRSAVRRGACPAGYRQLPPDAGGGLVLQVPAHGGPRQHHPLQRRSATTAPRWPQGQLRPGSWKSRNGWTAASWSSTGAEPWPRSRPPPNRRAQGPQRSASRQPPVDSHPLLDDIGHGAQTAAPRPPAKTQARIHPYRGLRPGIPVPRQPRSSACQE